MDNALRKFREDNYLLLIFIFFQIIIFIAVIISIFNLPKSNIDANEYLSKMSVSIENISNIFPNLNREDIKIIENELYESVKDNATDISLSKNVAQIREGTEREQYFTATNLNYFSAVVDIPELRQSYQIFYGYLDSERESSESTGRDRVTSLCLDDKDLIIYSDFKCKSRYDSSTFNYIVSEYMSQFRFEGLSAEVDENDIFKIVIRPYSYEISESKKIHTLNRRKNLSNL